MNNNMPNDPRMRNIRGSSVQRPANNGQNSRPMHTAPNTSPRANMQPPVNNGARRVNSPRNTKKTKRSTGKIFKISYLIYAAILAALVISALLYVNSVLNLYESEHPQRHLDKAVELLAKEAQSGELWKKEGVPSMESGVFEQNVDQKKQFIKKLNGDIKFTSQEQINETDCVYGIVSDGIVIAEVTLRKNGSPVQKLAIISIQKYELVSYAPINHTYTLELPADVSLGSDVAIKVNSVELTAEMGEKNNMGVTVFTLEDLYSAPEVSITDANGNKANYRLPDDKNGKIEFDNTFYTLTLPNHLFVAVDGQKLNGEVLDDGRFSYRIRLAKKANVDISDLYGNTVQYTGASTVPLTYYTFMTGDNCTVSVDGKKVPDSIMEISANPEYKNFADLVEGLPRLPVYTIVVLKDDAEITILDADGKTVSYDKEKKIQDLTGISSGTPLSAVPENVASEVNVIKVLEDWSLFMSCDLNFNSLSKHLIKSSYQYNVAWAYNISIDRTFTSNHGLGNPPFVEESATNFMWLTDNCFSVDIRFVKVMIVLGQRLDDEMNERCYFVKYDDTNDGKNNPQWKLVGMKEIVDNAK